MARAKDADMRDQLLALIRTDRVVREEVGRLMLESAVMQELKALREDMNRRFESARQDMDQRFESMRQDMNQCFESVLWEIKLLARQMGGLSETVGGDIEDIAYIVLHDVLPREFGWKVGVLERSWQTWNGAPEEVDVFGQAIDPKVPGKMIWVVGEAKHNITTREVERFQLKVARARAHLDGEVFPVVFCYRARPEVQEAIRAAGFRLVFSYGKLV